MRILVVLVFIPSAPLVFVGERESSRRGWVKVAAEAVDDRDGVRVVRVSRGQGGGSCAWAGCALAIFGVVALGFDGGGTAAAAAGAASSGLNVGDIIALFGAASYSLYIFRISTFGRQGLPGNLTQAWKTVILAVLYLGQGRIYVYSHHV